ncbi:hypothetical protein B484DRAFT_415315 [Ochromonadaceae sp. CCMP2298]|nr:hypothetical protein B484DRAFT_415315 [Ochromonadaceae sp. CCMP2298]
MSVPSVSAECPWPTLTAATLTMEQKFWLADRINNGVDTAALDTHALIAIREYIQIRGLDTTKEDILAEIAREYRATGERRRKVPEELTPISRRSQKRYVDLFIAYRDMVGTNSEAAMATLLAAN